MSKVEFRTLDGLTLRGLLYPAETRGPAIIITPGFHLVKEILATDVAQFFQRNGVTALAYDPRNYGDSDGQPRNHVDSINNTTDYMDALTYLKGLSIVEPNKIVVWGASWSGAVCLGAASLDPRVKLVISVCPMVQDFTPTPATAKMLRQCMKDRESQVKGNDPFYVPIVNEQGLNPVGFGPAYTKEDYHLSLRARNTVAPNFSPDMTLQSYFQLVQYDPLSTMGYFPQTPVMMVVPELDELSPPDLQIKIFDGLPGPKRMYLAPGQKHRGVVTGEHAEIAFQRQIDYLWEVLGPKP
ncbi:alpha/beta-hydrolase [Aspergillus ellipticus CBS 707.79]|uniref:Alpha/beta-hydrolase n=1 Tax=Aspergillus ellipticus CBS 707.79 TaxID=1448320 RepID=A0A319DQ76_9EURO|nr:alpha/beta-hydrolase [Aspergillus ellipticus CBS 707.79]